MRATRIATIALCLTLLVLPIAAIPIFPSDRDGNENRIPATFPSLVDEDEGLNQDFDEGFEAWLCDHFGLRDQAVRLHALIDYRLLHTASNDQVVPGSGGWLYFAESVPDYTGEGLLSDAELDTIAQNLGDLAATLDARGARLYVAIVPNKSTVYPQYMPGRYAMRPGGGNIPLLEAACAGTSAIWIDLVGPLCDAARGELPVYYRTDTHWNALGAAIAAEEVLRAMRRGVVEYSVEGEADFSGGDLARLLGIPRDLVERVPNVIPHSPLPEADFSEHLMTQKGEGEGTLVVYRDSFGTAIAPWLARAWAQSEFRWRSPLDGTRPCDDALLLICERNLRMYLMEPPYLEPEDGQDEEYSYGRDFAAGDFREMEEGDDFFEDEDDFEDEEGIFDDEGGFEGEDLEVEDDSFEDDSDFFDDEDDFGNEEDDWPEDGPGADGDDEDLPDDGDIAMREGAYGI